MEGSTQLELNVGQVGVDGDGHHLLDDGGVEGLRGVLDDVDAEDLRSTRLGT